MKRIIQGHKLDFFTRALPWVMSVLLFLLGLSLARGAINALERRPTFYYTRDTFPPLAGSGPFCPGGTLQYHSEYVFKAGDFNAVRIVRVLYDIRAARIVEPDTQEDWYIWTASDHDRPITSVISYKLPTSLPPGEYELRVAASLTDTSAMGYKVPFVVKPGCGTNSGAPLKGD